ncbi:hypothetical protein AK812_SmicGene15629 [Symbiodinium microadriaticum]|uniref:Uncharacterized protein n=1 Tax=Symbiodinium microadriaticum TaxID=2951 RepID=A0A1Q9E2H6_SYMMI|nr:hypothetical protein AK812_SmicGene15629 [Symbiodinium microadriaticum]
MVLARVAVLALLAQASAELSSTLRGGSRGDLDLAEEPAEEAPAYPQQLSDAVTTIEAGLKKAQRKEQQVLRLKQSLATQQNLLREGTELSHSFTDDPEQLQVVVGQLQQTQEMEEKDDLLLHQSEKEARAAAQQALDQANSLHQAAEAAKEQALQTQQRNKDLAMKAKVLEQRARMEGAKVFCPECPRPKLPWSLQ